METQFSLVHLDVKGLSCVGGVAGEGGAKVVMVTGRTDKAERLSVAAASPDSVGSLQGPHSASAPSPVATVLAGGPAELPGPLLRSAVG